jgi:hypothetical protein
MALFNAVFEIDGSKDKFNHIESQPPLFGGVDDYIIITKLVALTSCGKLP